MTFAAWSTAVGLMYGLAWTSWSPNHNLLVPILAHAGSNAVAALAWKADIMDPDAGGMASCDGDAIQGED